MKEFATIASPLYQLLRGKQEFFWKEDQQTAFETLKEKLTTAPILAYPDTQAATDGTRPFKVYTDACKDGLGAHLIQEGVDGLERTIYYEFKGTDKAAKNYAPTDLELLAVVFALNKFHYYLLRIKFHLYTDHQPLVRMIKSKEMTSGRRGRYMAAIIEFSKMEIYYKPGRMNTMADALSRLPTATNYNTPTIYGQSKIQLDQTTAEGD